MLGEDQIHGERALEVEEASHGRSNHSDPAPYEGNAVVAGDGKQQVAGLDRGGVEGGEGREAAGSPSGPRRRGSRQWPSVWELADGWPARGGRGVGREGGVDGEQPFWVCLVECMEGRVHELKSSLLDPLLGVW